MYQLSQQIIAYFTAQTAFTNVVAQDIYAVIAPENQNFPFVTFRISSQETATKDLDEYQVALFLWFEENQYDQAVQFVDVVTNLVKQNNNWDWQFSSVDFIEENASFVGMINFKKV